MTQKKNHRWLGETGECVGKKQYLSYYSADRDSTDMNRKQAGKRKPYRCTTCHYWHVGGSLHNTRKLNRHAKREYEDYGRIEFSE